MKLVMTIATVDDSDSDDSDDDSNDSEDSEVTSSDEEPETKKRGKTKKKSGNGKSKPESRKTKREPKAGKANQNSSKIQMRTESLVNDEMHRRKIAEFFHRLGLNVNLEEWSVVYDVKTSTFQYYKLGDKRYDTFELAVYNLRSALQCQ